LHGLVQRLDDVVDVEARSLMLAEALGNALDRGRTQQALALLDDEFPLTAINEAPWLSPSDDQISERPGSASRPISATTIQPAGLSRCSGD